VLEAQGFGQHEPPGKLLRHAVMESFWGTLKTELVYQEHYKTREAGAAVDLE